MNRIVLCALLLIVLAACAGRTENAGNGPVQTAEPGATPTQILMTTPRAGQAAVLLHDGRVLICGGTSNDKIGGVLASAELLDPSGRFVPTGSMSTPRQGHTITLLHNGKALIVGGVENVGFRAQLASAELYDPATGKFTQTGSMETAREGHTATLLSDGRVLIAGGSDNGAHTIASAEIYDPTIGTFSPTGNMTVPRDAHTATLLLSGKVLIAGGGRSDLPGGYIILPSAELYDPKTGRFSALGASMTTDRVGHTATRLNDGKVLIAGGRSRLLGVTPGFSPLASAELYDPKSARFVPTGSMSDVHYLQTATELPDGNVLIAGGWNMQFPAPVGMADAEIYAVDRGQWAGTGNLLTPRLIQSATLLSDGRVLIAGGLDGKANVLASVEFYQPQLHAFTYSPRAEAQ